MRIAKVINKELEVEDYSILYEDFKAFVFNNFEKFGVDTLEKLVNNGDVEIVKSANELWISIDDAYFAIYKIGGENGEILLDEMLHNE